MRKTLSSLALLAVLLCGCRHTPTPKVLALEGLGTPAEVAAKALLTRAEVISLAGERAAIVQEGRSETGSSSSQIPLISDLIGAPGLLNVQGREFTVKGDKGEASLSVQMRQRGDGPWTLHRWEVQSVAAREIERKKAEAELAPVPEQEGYKKAVLETVARNYADSPEREVYLSRRALLLTPKESTEEILAAVVVYDWKKGAWRLGFVPMKYAGNAWKPGKARSWKKMESAPDLSAFQRID